MEATVQTCQRLSNINMCWMLADGQLDTHWSSASCYSESSGQIYNSQLTMFLPCPSLLQKAMIQCAEWLTSRSFSDEVYPSEIFWGREQWALQTLHLSCVSLFQCVCCFRRAEREFAMDCWWLTDVFGVLVSPDPDLMNDGLASRRIWRSFCRESVLILDVRQSLRVI